MIDFQTFNRIGDSKKMEIWQNLHSILSARRGDVQDHAVLLCSLLLGFHLDAYVTLGTDKDNSPHIWVTTIGAKGELLDNNRRRIFLGILDGDAIFTTRPTSF
jgi:centrosomal protein CEP76